jgi:hypothetical protein
MTVSMVGIMAVRCIMTRIGPSAGSGGKPGGGNLVTSWAATGASAVAASKSSRTAEGRMDQLLDRDAVMMARLAAAVTPELLRPFRAAK